VSAIIVRGECATETRHAQVGRPGSPRAGKPRLGQRQAAGAGLSLAVAAGRWSEVERAAHGQATALEHVGVDHRRAYIPMAQWLLARSFRAIGG